jgi:hypothetical protein
MHACLLREEFVEHVCVNEIADTLALKTIAAICNPSQLEVLHFAPSLDDCSLVLGREVRMVNDLCVRARSSRSGLR